MKETNLTMFYNDALKLIFNACDTESQKAIAHTSSQWHQIMFKIREDKAKEALKSLGQADLVNSEKMTFQQQYSEKMLLLDQRAKRLADWFTSTPPNPKYTGEFIPLGMFGGGHQEFRSFASNDMNKHIFQDNQFFPHIIIERAIKKYGYSHAATCPLDTMHTNILEVFVSSNNPHLLKNYLDKFHDNVYLNVENQEGELLFEVASYEQQGVQRLEVMEILIEYGAVIQSDRLNNMFENIKDDDDFDFSRWNAITKSAMSSYLLNAK